MAPLLQCNIYLHTRLRNSHAISEVTMAFCCTTSNKMHPVVYNYGPQPLLALQPARPYQVQK